MASMEAAPPGARGPGPAGMRPRSQSILYNGAAAGWLALAAASLLLPNRTRLGLWLPLHLAVVGAVSTAIAGNMQVFAVALSGAPEPRRPIVLAQFAALTAGVATMAFGYPGGHPAATAAGGTLVMASALLLAWLIAAARRRGVNPRHGAVTASYLAAIGFLVVGGTIGAVLGSGAVSDPQTYEALRRVHLAVNVLGWVSVTIAATMVTLLPTVLRTRMAAWSARATLAPMIGGLVVFTTGLGLRMSALAAAGAAVYAAGVAGIVGMAIRVIRGVRGRVPTREARAGTVPGRGVAIPASARHMMFGLAWFACLQPPMVVAVARGGEAFDRFLPLYLVGFVLGWVVQVLLGAWLHLVPTSRAMHPDDRRRVFAFVDRGSMIHVSAMNVGLALMALRATGMVPVWMGAAGTAVALAGGGVSFVKVWGFPLVVRSTG
jgi:nitrite reductase (NO-forming)